MLALIILFQPEIRRILEEMGSRRILALFTRTENASVLEQTIEQTVLACSEMSQSRTGALIVFEREILLDDMVRSGTVLDAAVSSELLKNIFFVKAPMHDGGGHRPPRSGAGGGVHAPPEQERESVPGFRHAAPGGHRHERKLRRGGGHRIGGDRLYLVATGGMLKRHLKPETLDNLLRNELLPQEEAGTEKQKFSLTGLLRSRKDGGA